MAVLFWVQHLLGSGHLKRAAILARAIGKRGLRVVIASGGTPAPWLLGDDLELVQLPPVRASDLSFASLLDEHDRPIDDRFRAPPRPPARVVPGAPPGGDRDRDASVRPARVPVRAAAALEAAAARPRPWRLCSVRDVVRKPDPEGWCLDAAQAHAHSIASGRIPTALILLELTFPTPQRSGSPGRDRLRDRSRCGAHRRGPGRGAGPAGAPGRRAIARGGARGARSDLPQRPWRLIAGGHPPATRSRRSPSGCRGARFGAQRDNFPALLANSLLSVSRRLQHCPEAVSKSRWSWYHSTRQRRRNKEHERSVWCS
jgi:hypothetical protein